MRDLRLSIVDSRRPDTETLIDTTQSFIIFDQAILDVFILLTGAQLAKVSGRILPEQPTDPWWVNALYANRYSSAGLGEEALIQANLAVFGRKQQGVPRVDVQLVEEWVKIQAAFTVAHEVAHCWTAHGGSLAAAVVVQFESFNREYVEQLDAQSPVDVWPRPELQFAVRLSEFIKSELLAVDPELSFNGAPTLPYRSRSEELDAVVSDPTGFGEEVLADYISLVFTSKLMAEDPVSYDEALIASSLALRHVMLMRFVDIISRSYTGSAPHPQVVVALADELEIRNQFAKITAINLCMHDQVRWQTESASSEDQQERRRARVEGLLAALNRHETVWRSDILPAVITFQATRTDRLRGALADNPEALKLAHSAAMAGAVADMTWIGRPSQGRWD